MSSSTFYMYVHCAWCVHMTVYAVWLLCCVVTYSNQNHRTFCCRVICVCIELRTFFWCTHSRQRTKINWTKTARRTDFCLCWPTIPIGVSSCILLCGCQYEIVDKFLSTCSWVSGLCALWSIWLVVSTLTILLGCITNWLMPANEMCLGILLFNSIMQENRVNTRVA